MAYINCPKCNAIINSTFSNCSRCGLDLTEIVICEKCLNAEFKFQNKCSKCGANLPQDKTTDRKADYKSNDDVCDQNANSMDFLTIEKTYTEKENVESVINNETTLLGCIQDVMKRSKIQNSEDRFIRFNGGQSLLDSEKIRKIFMIPNNVDVYLAISATVFGNFKEGINGFTITSDGIYYKEGLFRKGKIDYDLFAKLEIKNSSILSNLCIGEYTFVYSDHDDYLWDLLLKMQRGIRKIIGINKSPENTSYSNLMEKLLSYVRLADSRKFEVDCKIIDEKLHSSNVDFSNAFFANLTACFYYYKLLEIIKIVYDKCYLLYNRRALFKVVYDTINSEIMPRIYNNYYKFEEMFGGCPWIYSAFPESYSCSDPVFLKKIVEHTNETIDNIFGRLEILEKSEVASLVKEKWIVGYDILRGYEDVIKMVNLCEVYHIPEYYQVYTEDNLKNEYVEYDASEIIFAENNLENIMIECYSMMKSIDYMYDLFCKVKNL